MRTVVYMEVQAETSVHEYKPVCFTKLCNYQELLEGWSANDPAREASSSCSMFTSLVREECGLAEEKY